VIPLGWTGKYGQFGTTWYWPSRPGPEIVGFGWAIVYGLEFAPPGTKWFWVVDGVERRKP